MLALCIAVVRCSSYFEILWCDALIRPIFLFDPQLRKRKADASSTDRAANAGNDRKQKRAASSRSKGESAPNFDDDKHTEQSGAGHTETDVIGEEVRFVEGEKAVSPLRGV